MTRLARAVRRVILRTARSPLARIWGALYRRIARWVARKAAPDDSRASVYLAGSVASGEPIYGLSDIDLVVVAEDEEEAAAAQGRFDALCRRLPPLRDLIPHFWVYSGPQLARVLRGPHPLFELEDGAPAFVGPDAHGDPMAILERPGLAGAAGNWRLLRGEPRTPARARREVAVSAWLELQYRWRYAFKLIAEPVGTHAASHAVALVSDAARVLLRLADGEAVKGRREPLERALAAVDGEAEGIEYALYLYARLHRSPPVDLALIFPCFVRISELAAALSDQQSFAEGHTRVALISEARDTQPLLDWRALAVPRIDWTTPELPFVVEERLWPLPKDPRSPAVLAEVAGIPERPEVPVLRLGRLLVQPTFDIWGAGRLRIVQSRATDPVSAAVLDGRDHALFPDARGWSAHDRARRAVAEYRAWLAAGSTASTARTRWLGDAPASEWATPATLGLLLSAGRAALLLESIEQGQPRLPLGLSDTGVALRDQAPLAPVAWAVLDDCRRRPRAPSEDLVRRLREQILALGPYRAEPAESSMTAAQ